MCLRGRIKTEKHCVSIIMYCSQFCSYCEKKFLNIVVRLDVDEKAKDIFLKILKEKGLNQPPHFVSTNVY